MDSAAAKQQIAERVKQAGRFLVTVNANPTVDQLAACIGLALLINKMNKHATAVFSGQVPSTIEFLQPEKTLESTPDSLRDFIISLDKNKADKLRYKVEDDVVRIYISPYRTSLSASDFVFSEGDYNVEVVIALGVTQRANLDQSITAHGKILHDATVISLNAGAGKAPDLGQINWQDPQASSLSEMLVSISEAFGPGLIDAQIATAFLTGIVSETARFSNKKTTPKVMTMSAQLMAAGANQQLIVSKLEPPMPPASPSQPRQPKPKLPTLSPEGIMDVPKDIPGNKGGKTDIELGTTEIHIDEQGNIKTNNNVLGPEPIEEPAPPLPEPVGEPPAPPQPPSAPAAPAGPPKPHAFLGSSAQPPDMAFPDNNQPEWAAPYEMSPEDPMREAPQENANPSDEAVAIDDPSAESANFSKGKTIQPLSAKVTPMGSPVDSARNAVEEALSKSPSNPVVKLPEETHSDSTPDEDETGPVEVQGEILPPPPPSDTPMLVLPTEGSGPISAAPPTPPPIQNSDAPAPPPTPPPLISNGIPGFRDK